MVGLKQPKDMHFCFSTIILLSCEEWMDVEDEVESESRETGWGCVLGPGAE